MELPSVFIDFNDMYGPNCFGLGCKGTQEDLLRQNITLAEGLRLEVRDSEISAIGTVRKGGPNEGCYSGCHWVIDVDKDSLKNIE